MSVATQPGRGAGSTRKGLDAYFPDLLRTQLVGNRGLGPRREHLVQNTWRGQGDSEMIMGGEADPPRADGVRRADHRRRPLPGRPGDRLPGDRR